MAVEFMSEDFLLQTETARVLYHEHAAQMPIYDYHCHLSAEQIAADAGFENLTQAWLYGDHYKWRAMRANGVDERYCTGEAGDWEKFEKWAQTVPYCLRNPLYHWTHLELRRPFGITGKLLGPDTAREIYDAAGDMLNTPEFTIRNILREMNVRLICTTQDPLDSLEHHQKIKTGDFEISVHTAFRPDKAMAAENVGALNKWIDGLARLTDTDIGDYATYIEAIDKRHEYFHDNGCRLSDHGLAGACAAEYTESEIAKIFQDIRASRQPDLVGRLKFKSAMMLELARMNHSRRWVQQLHLGALRNTNTRMLKTLGPDTGFDSIGDFPQASVLANFLDKLNCDNRLAKTILYNLNPADNEVLATMTGNFQDGSTPGKMQYGSGWWFLDQKDGMTSQIDTLSNMGLLSRFVGMVTDSRSFLSFPRHEYFRRILCNILGNDVETGDLPKEMSLLGRMVEDICYNNAKNYFTMQCD